VLNISCLADGASEKSAPKLNSFSASAITLATNIPTSFSLRTPKIPTPAILENILPGSATPGRRQVPYLGTPELPLERSRLRSQHQDGIAVDWPIRYADLAPWYDYVEEFAGISGQAEGLPQLPDSKFLPPMEMTCVEQDFPRALTKHYDDRMMTIGPHRDSHSRP